MGRRDLFTLVGALALSGAERGFAEAYPARPVRIIAGFAAGGGVDITARLISHWLSNRLGQPFVAEASAGTGSAPHMAGELFCAMAGVAMTHVPYRGQSPALSDRRCRILLGGQVRLLFAAAPGTVDYVRSGALKALAVTSAEVLRELPLVASSLPGYEASQWYGISAPHNIPPEIVERLNREINAAFTDDAMQSRFAAISGDRLPGSPAAFGKLVADETEKWAKVVKFAQPKVE
jgi:tripartite-type tricarboxylate transporter receptor subunit TctC